MAVTFTYSTDAAPGDEPVIAQSNCNKITIKEKDPLGTTYFLVRDTLKTNSQIIISAGSQYTFYSGRNGAYTQGTIVGYTSAGTGTITMQQVETAEGAPGY